MISEQLEDLEGEDPELKGLMFELPKFGVSPGPTPSPSLPSAPSTPSHFSVSDVSIYGLPSLLSAPSTPSSHFSVSDLGYDFYFFTWTLSCNDW